MKTEKAKDKDSKARYKTYIGYVIRDARKDVAKRISEGKPITIDHIMVAGIHRSQEFLLNRVRSQTGMVDYNKTEKIRYDFYNTYYPGYPTSAMEMINYAITGKGRPEFYKPYDWGKSKHDGDKDYIKMKADTERLAAVDIGLTMILDHLYYFGYMRGRKG